jgi:hypothetical protein
MSDKESSHGSAGNSGFSLLGAIVGAVWGAIVGARLPTDLSRLHTEIEIESAISPSVSYSRKAHFPARPAPDWTDPKPATLPKPTYAPASVAFGIMLAAAGVVTSFWVSLAGLIVFIIGVHNWIGDLLHEHK